MNEISEAVRRWRFPQTYAEGRTWFLSTAAAAGADVVSAINPHATGPDGDELATDVAWFGPRAAGRVFLSICGTHGQEYFAGVATQLQWIVDRGPATLPPGVALCMVHAHNPYGAAWGSRANENFVDLNRNYFDGDEAGRPNPLYAELFGLLFTDEMDEHVLDEVMDSFEAFVERSDPQAAMTAMGGGQATHPSGNIFCGSAAEWSTEQLRALVRDRFGAAEKVALIDWHTGLGAFGQVTLLPEAAGVAEVDEWMRRWWGGTEAGDALQGPNKPRFVGQVVHGVARDLRRRGVSVASTVAEFGTFGNRGVLAALLIDRWLRFACRDRASPKAVRLHTIMMERLNPTLPEWRQLVLSEGARINDSTVAGLAHWI